jgi:hypothetical protein
MINLQEAIQAIKSGDKAQGRSLLLQILKTNPQHENAWLWLAAAVEEPQQKRDCLQKVLAINPNNQTAKAGLKQLTKQIETETEEEPKLQDIIASPLNSVYERPRHKTQQEPIGEEFPQDDPGQAGEIVTLYLKLIGFIALPISFFGTLVFMVFFAFALSAVSDMATGNIGVVVPFSEIFLGMFSVGGLQLIYFFGGHWVAIMLVIMCLVLGTWHVVAVRRLPGGKKAGALQVRQARQLRVNLPYEQTLHACQGAVLMRGGQVVSANPKSGRIIAKTGISLKSSGETILFQVGAIDDDLTQVTILSKPALRTVLVDLGRNLENVEAISSYLDIQEKQAVRR